MPKTSKKTPVAQRDLLTIPELAARWGVRERFIRRLIYERRIAVVRLGRFIRFDISDVEDFETAGHAPAASLNRTY